jgi:hypothetical protein
MRPQKLQTRARGTPPLKTQNAPIYFQNAPKNAPIYVKMQLEFVGLFNTNNQGFQREMRGGKEKSQTSLEGAGFLIGADYRHHTILAKPYNY